jgi:nucleotide-binding universal stress UspA family protein
MPKVLTAIDGSEHAAQALKTAAGLFGGSADHVLISVVPPSWPPRTISVDGDVHTSGGSESGVRTHGASTGTSPYAPTSDSVVVAQEAVYVYYRTAQDQAAVTAGITDFEHLIGEATSRPRRIGREICDRAEQYEADVVVVGAHGSSHTGEILMGSVSQYVLHHAPCPVLVVRESR